MPGRDTYCPETTQNMATSRHTVTHGAAAASGLAHPGPSFQMPSLLRGRHPHVPLPRDVKSTAISP